MSKYAITGGVRPTALKTVVYGPEGIGKTTFASCFPKAVFIDTEGSTKFFDLARFPVPTSWTMLLDEVQEVINDPTVCDTLVIDTADWAEKMCIAEVCSANNKKGIEDFGYGKGYTYVYEAFAKLLHKLEDAADKGVNIVLTAHAALRKFEQPDEMGAYDRWELKLLNSPKANICAMVKEWAGKFEQHVQQSPTPEQIPQQQPMQPAHTKIDKFTEPPQTAPVQPPKARTNGIPKALADLMQADGITEGMIRKAVAAAGHFPEDTPIANYGDEYINGFIIGQWDSLVGFIRSQTDNGLPF